MSGVESGLECGGYFCIGVAVLLHALSEPVYCPTLAIQWCPELYEHRVVNCVLKVAHWFWSWEHGCASYSSSQLIYRSNYAVQLRACLCTMASAVLPCISQIFYFVQFSGSKRFSAICRGLASLVNIMQINAKIN